MMAIKIFLLLLSILLTSTESFSQALKPCTCIPNDELDYAQFLIRKGQLDQAKVLLLEKKIDTLEAVNLVLQGKVTDRDSAIVLYKKLENNYNKMEAKYGMELHVCDRQLKAERKISEDLFKQVKARRRETVIVGITGVLLAVLVKVL